MRLDLKDKKTIGIIVGTSMIIIVAMILILWKVAFQEPEEVWNSDIEAAEDSEGLALELDDKTNTEDAGVDDNLEEVEEQEEDEEVEEQGVDEEEAQLEDFVQEPVLKVLAGETSGSTMGIDVSEYQGVIDWGTVSTTDIEFAMIRIGVSSSDSGSIREDSCARYNLQEATANEIQVGAYFYSNAITQEEVLAEVDFLCDILDDYSITYPVVYDCEGYKYSSNRTADLTVDERTDLAMLFMEEVENRGYVAMFYGSTSDLSGDAYWNTSEIELRYRIWVAQYVTFSEVTTSMTPSYAYEFAMWQYSCTGTVAGISEDVDLNIAYFGCGGSNDAIDSDTVDKVEANVEVGVTFEEVNDEIMAKEEVNVRSSMDYTDDSNILGTLYNGTVVTRTGIGSNGWSRISYGGETGYVITQYITTDLSYEVEEESEFKTQFTEVYEEVTAIEITNLRDMPSVEDPSQVIYELINGEVAIRTGVANEGWSRVEYKGEVLYCISSYLELVE